MNVLSTNKAVIYLVGGTGHKISEEEGEVNTFLSFESCECIAYSEFLKLYKALQH